MAEKPLLTIGQLARRTGVPVRTIRFWSDEGVLPETDRSSGNYRRYDSRAVARLDLVRTLRELGMGLDDIRLVLERRRSVEDVAAAHVQPSTTRSASCGPSAPCARCSRGALRPHGRQHS
jgi:DNA-binding transcriptional MerR regulator